MINVKRFGIYTEFLHIFRFRSKKQMLQIPLLPHSIYFSSHPLNVSIWVHLQLYSAWPALTMRGEPR